jgi:hypothetical protein
MTKNYVVMQKIILEINYSLRFQIVIVRTTALVHCEARILVLTTTVQKQREYAITSNNSKETLVETSK